MLRRTRPWWALLTTIALVSASLLAPRDGAAYRIVGNADPVDRNKLGDPDDPDDAPQLGRSQTAKPVPQIVLVLHIAPGVTLTIPIRVSAFFTRRASRSPVQ